ncbi:hypothetical protein ACGCUP_00910 [Eubacteriales bacterium KG125]
MKIINSTKITNKLQSLTLDTPVLKNKSNFIFIDGEKIKYTVPLGLPIDKIGTEILIEKDGNFVGKEIVIN